LIEASLRFGLGLEVFCLSLPLGIPRAYGFVECNFAQLCT
jgi:hypothetical protein